MFCTWVELRTYQRVSAVFQGTESGCLLLISMKCFTPEVIVLRQCMFSGFPQGNVISNMWGCGCLDLVGIGWGATVSAEAG